MSYASTVLADGAVGYWRLGESDDSNPAVDETAHQNGVYSNVTGITPGQTGLPGAGGTATLFIRASSGFVAIADNAAFHVGDVFTVEAWSKRTSTNQHLTMFSSSSGGPCIRIEQTTNKLTLLKDVVAVIVSSTSGISDTSAFHHYVATKNAATVKLYIDGADVTGTVTNATVGNSAGQWIAGDKAAASDFFDGTIGEVALYPTALSAGTVSNHYAIGSTAPYLKTGVNTSEFSALGPDVDIFARTGKGEAG